MADLTSSSLTPRPVAAPEAAGRVGRTAAASDQASPQQHDPQTEGRQAPREDTPHTGHHDPAVTLAASLAHVEAGAILAAALQGLNGDGRPVASAGATQYLIDADAKLLAQVRAALDGADNATILVVSVERTITALLIAVDGKPLPASLPITLTIIKADPSVENFQPPLPPAPAATATYRPAPTFARPQDPDGVFLPAAAPAHGSVQAEKLGPVFGNDTPSPRANVSLPLLAAAGAPPLPAAPVINTTFHSVLLPLQPIDTAVLSTPHPVIVSVSPVTAAPLVPHTSASSLMVQGIVKNLPGNIAEVPGAPSAHPSPATLGIETALGIIPLPPDTALPQDSVVMVRLIPAPSQAATGILSDQASAQGAALPPTTATAIAMPALMTPWPDTLLPEPREPWPLMQSLLAATVIDPAFNAALMSKLPSPERPINPAFLLFLNLLGVSSPAKLLLGPGGDTWFRKNGAEETLTRWQSGIEQLKRIGADRAAGEWRPFMIPFHSPQSPHGPYGIESILMLVRHSPGDPAQDQSQSGTDQDGNDNRVTRFVLDLRLSRLGATQIDGIIQDKTFNLAIRTERPLGTAQEHDLRGIFARALESNSFSGDISFPSGLPFPVDGAREWHTALKTGGALSA